MSAGRSVGETVREAAGHAPPASPFRQPRGVWTVAFACVVSFMGIGLVDPILPALSSQLHASPSAVELLFTSYLIGGGLAPFAAARLAADFNVHVPFYLGAVTVAAAIGVLASGHRLLTRAEQGTGELPETAGEPAVPAPAPIVVAVAARPGAADVIRHADCEVHLVPATPGPLRRATVARSS